MRKLIIFYALVLIGSAGPFDPAMAADHCDGVALKAAIGASSSLFSSTEIKANLDNPKSSRIEGSPHIDQCGGAHCTVFSVSVAEDDQWRYFRTFEVRLITASCYFVSVADTDRVTVVPQH